MTKYIKGREFMWAGAEGAVAAIAISIQIALILLLVYLCSGEEDL
jgi:hypothetical protein